MWKLLERGMEKRLVKTAIIAETGFDGGGTTKLGIEYSKLGLPVYFRNTIQPLQFKPDDVGNIKLYESDSELFDIATKYERLIFLPLALYDRNLTPELHKLIKIRSNNRNVELCYLFCNRKSNRVEALLNLCNENKFVFDHYFSISPSLSKYVENCTYLNINAFTFFNYPDISKECRKPIIFSAGRVESVKGTTAYFQSINDKFLSDDYYYIHEGAKYSFNKNGNVSVSPQLFSLFDMNSKPKKLQYNYRFLSYEDFPSIDKLNIYPSYKLDDALSRWSTYYLGICCILGSSSVCRKVKSLFGYSFITDDASENERLNRNSRIWNDALEYADIEKISVGVPVLFSRKYAEKLNFLDERLIYDSFSEIPDKAHSLNNYYEDCRNNQYNFFKDRQLNINKLIVGKFTGSIS